MDYQFDTLDLADDSEAGRTRNRAWLQTVMHGFHEGRIEDDYEKVWRTHLAADGVVCRGAWLPEGAYGAGPAPVATTSWFDKTLNLGRELLPLRMITDVTTSPAHRRRGLVRRLMEDCLDDAVAAGLPVAALTVSEATIYGRWGFGAATFGQEVELDTGPRFGLRDFTDPGRVELVDPDHRLAGRLRAARAVPPAQPRLGRRTPVLRAVLHRRLELPGEGPGHEAARSRAPRRRRAGRRGRALATGRPRRAGKRKIKVMLHLADDPIARLALWQFLGGLDLVTHVSYGDFPPADPLPWALRDLNALKLANRYEFLWVRVLDVARALAARPWTDDGDVVLDVSDAQGHAAGRYRVVTRGGTAEVSPTDSEADLALDVEALGSLSLGGVDVTTLHAAGRVRGERRAAARFAAMADLADEPYNILGF